LYCGASNWQFRNDVELKIENVAFLIISEGDIDNLVFEISARLLVVGKPFRLPKLL